MGSIPMQGLKFTIMKSIMKYLFFDKDVVTTIKTANVDDNQLYNLLFTGRITLEEYVVGSKA